MGCRKAMLGGMAAVNLALALFACGRVAATRSGDAASQASADADAVTRPDGSSGAEVVDASSDVTADVHLVDDAGFAVAARGQTACDRTVCNAADEVCCRTSAGFACAPLNGCTGEILECSSALSCPSGRSCCGDYAGELRNLVSTECLGRCNLGAQLRLCATNDPCPDGGTCEALEGGFGFCWPLDG